MTKILSGKKYKEIARYHQDSKILAKKSKNTIELLVNFIIELGISR